MRYIHDPNHGRVRALTRSEYRKHSVRHAIDDAQLLWHARTEAYRAAHGPSGDLHAMDPAIEIFILGSRKHPGTVVRLCPDLTAGTDAWQPAIHEVLATLAAAGVPAYYLSVFTW